MINQASHDDENPGQDASGGDDQDATTGEEPSVPAPVPLTSTKLVRRARRLLAQVAPAEAEESAATRRAHALGVQVYPHDEPGLSVLRAVLPTYDAMRVLAGVNELAGHLHQDTTTSKSLDECRVDAFTELFLGNVTVDTTCVLRIPVIPTGHGAGPGLGVAGFTPKASGAVPAPGRVSMVLAGAAGGFSCGGPVKAPALVSSSVEPRMRELLRSSSREGLDLLAGWVRRARLKAPQPVRAPWPGWTGAGAPLTTGNTCPPRTAKHYATPREQPNKPGHPAPGGGSVTQSSKESASSPPEYSPSYATSSAPPSPAP
ncbi:hypothetical protein [Flexivirga caeni]|uniref:DUF222 domain-containing protein n=1 Tax=Flexivirga caeni TaxID=2294115 RepID=A0A3M9MF33_9MICO|nr:hypothetical protein [Flexivirga caeni]RNI23248.1 hypothetical protein EFY87_07415 [Flexivirga caeni]